MRGRYSLLPTGVEIRMSRGSFAQGQKCEPHFIHQTTPNTPIAPLRN